VSTPSQQGVASGPPLLDLQRVVRLTDAASELFRISYDLERRCKQAIRARLAAELASVDLFDSGPHYTNYEDYVPGGGTR